MHLITEIGLQSSRVLVYNISDRKVTDDGTVLYLSCPVWQLLATCNWPSSTRHITSATHDLNFIYYVFIWLPWVVFAACGLSLQLQRARVALQSLCMGFSFWWVLLLWTTGSRAQPKQLWSMGLVVLRHVGSSQTKDLTHMPGFGRQILKHWTTREIP